MLLNLVFAVLWPARCPACSAEVREGVSFCERCSSTLLPLGPCCPGCAMPSGGPRRLCGGCRCRPFPFTRADVPLAYGGSITQAILRFKHGGHRHLAAPLARHLGPALSEVWQAVDLVCPVPLHRSRLKARGFNQALELARAVARTLPRGERGKICCDLLDRTIDTPALGHGSPATRARAVAGAFVVSTRPSVEKRRVLVVDDVMTTGATLAECARTLLDAGAAEVSVAALARAI